MKRSTLFVSVALLLVACTTPAPSLTPPAIGSEPPPASPSAVPSTATPGPLGIGIDCGPLSSDQPACLEAVGVAVRWLGAGPGSVATARIAVPTGTCPPNARCARGPDLQVLLGTTGGTFSIGLIRQASGGWVVLYQIPSTG